MNKAYLPYKTFVEFKYCVAYDIYFFDNFLNSILNTVCPILRSIPCLEVGMPILRARRCFVCVIPNALFHEKLTPDIFIMGIVEYTINF